MELSYDPVAIPLLHIPKNIESRHSETYLYIHAHKKIIHSNQRFKTTQCSPASEWISKMWSVDTIEYYSALKRNEF
jgi:hypothetical protein